jgi:hypothetical protein
MSMEWIFFPPGDLTGSNFVHIKYKGLLMDVCIGLRFYLQTLCRRAGIYSTHLNMKDYFFFIKFFLSY